ncbi:MAG: YfcE family phosphodiesterase [Planctomycetales bacterium]|nr:YfcE family phosphodiesterase [Planctomycetales bacterium]
MLLGVVSDTHGHLRNSLDAVRMLESLDVEAVIHCGDIGSTRICALFSAWPTHFVFGNVDDNQAELREEILAQEQTCHDRFGELQLAGRRIAFLHGDDQQRLREAAASESYDLVCYGHTHYADQTYVGKTLLLNPGALYRARPRSLAVVDLNAMTATIVPL